MFDLLPDRLAWYVAGPLLGLLVAGLYAVANAPLGASGGYVQTIGFVRRRPGVDVWRVWYLGGIAIGAFVATALADNLDLRAGYEALHGVMPYWLLVPVLFVGATVMGYGARMAGGCTSGHGLCGTSGRNPSSFVATGTFMATAIVVTAILSVITGGDL